MSVFASQTQSDPIPIPFDPPHTIVVRKLTGKEYQSATSDHEGRITALFRRALVAGGVKDPAVFAALENPLTGHDRYALVRAGLVSWSYPQALTPIKAQPTATPPIEAYDAVGDLDDETVDFIATEVLRLTKPSFFVKVEAVEDANTQSTAAAPAA